APGARLELEAPVLDLEGARALLLAFELEVLLPGLVLGGDEPERADDENQEEEEVQLRHASGSFSEIRFRKAGSRGAAVRAAGRSFAMRARGLVFTSASVGRMTRPAILSGACGISLARIGKSSGTSGRLQARRKRFTSRSSSEWKLITASLAPGARRASAWGS